MKKPALKPVSLWTKAPVVIGVLVLIVMIIALFKSNLIIVQPDRISDGEAREKIGNALEDYGIYMNHLEKVAYQKIEDLISQFSYRGIAQSSRMMEALETELTNGLDSLDARWRTLTRSIKDILSSAGLRELDIKKVDFLSVESTTYDSLGQETVEVKDRIQEFASRKKRLLGYDQ